jgi:hypothetical protein
MSSLLDHAINKFLDVSFEERRQLGLTFQRRGSSANAVASNDLYRQLRRQSLAFCLGTALDEFAVHLKAVEEEEEEEEEDEKEESYTAATAAASEATAASTSTQATAAKDHRGAASQQGKTSHKKKEDHAEINGKGKGKKGEKGKGKTEDENKGLTAVRHCFEELLLLNGFAKDKVDARWRQMREALLFCLTVSTCDGPVPGFCSNHVSLAHSSLLFSLSISL